MTIDIPQGMAPQEILQLLLAIIGPITYIIVDRLKVHIHAPRAIPDIAAGIAAILVILTLLATGPWPFWVWLVVIFQGVQFGYAASGYKQAKNNREV